MVKIARICIFTLLIWSTLLHRATINKRLSVIPLTHGQAMNAKYFTFVPTCQFWRPRRIPGQTFTNLGNNVQQDPFYQSAKFRPVLATCLWAICCQMLISLTTWQRAWTTNWQTNIQTSASVKDWCMSPHGITEPPDKVHKIGGIRLVRPLACQLSLRYDKNVRYILQ